MFKKSFVVLTVLLTAALLNSCSDRGVTSVTEKYDHGSVVTNQHTFPDYLANSMFPSVKLTTLVGCKVYVPSGYDPSGTTGEPLPVLYLLSPMGEDEFFYLNHGLTEIADQMIASKQIKPMIIVSVNGSNGYGGSFYGGSPAGGEYDRLIGTRAGDAVNGSLIAYVDAYYKTDTSRNTRAISGLEMGGYGAMRIATKYSENFGSASAVSAPLDFDGAGGNGGFVPLFQQVVSESGVPYHDLDTSYTKPLQTMFFAAAASFSPYDTGAIGGGVITDSTTFFNPEVTIKLLLPFDSVGAVYTPIWNLWLANNLPNLMSLYPNSLDSVSILLMASPQAEYGFYQQTHDFYNAITSASHTFEEYTGYTGYSASDGRVIYDLLPKILKFHSDHFILP